MKAGKMRKDYLNQAVTDDQCYLAKRRGLLGFTAEVLAENQPVFRLFEKMRFDVQKRNDFGVYEMMLLFKDVDQRLTSGAS